MCAAGLVLRSVDSVATPRSDVRPLVSQHPVFGKVVGEDGLDVVHKIAKSRTDDNERPVKALKVTRITIL